MFIKTLPNKNLGKLTPDQRRAILKDFISATLPFEVLGIRKDKGQPLQLANAFESPVKSNGKGPSHLANRQ